MKKLKFLEKAMFFSGWCCFVLIVWFTYKASSKGFDHSNIEAIVAVVVLVVFSLILLIHQLIWQNQENPRIKKKRKNV